MKYATLFGMFLAVSVLGWLHVVGSTTIGLCGMGVVYAVGLLNDQDSSVRRAEIAAQAANDERLHEIQKLELKALPRGRA